MQRLHGKVALVTGGGSGIGRGCSFRLAAEGASVVVADLEGSEGADTAATIRSQGGKAVFQPVDVRRERACQVAVQKTVEVFGGLDVLVNNAGIYPRARLEETTEDLWEEIISINLKGPFFLCKYSVPEMRRQGGGSIINVGSVHGLGGAGNLVAYSVSKGGLLTLTRNLAVALGNPKDRIRVNYVIPGWVLSATEIRIQSEEGRDENWLKEKAARLAMGRYQTPEDAANVIAFLASDEAAMITGCVLNNDGGYSVRCIGTEDADTIRGR